MAIIEQLHRFEVHAPAFEHHLQQAVHIEVDIGDGGEKRLFYKGVNLGIGLAQAARMMLVGGHALKPVKQDFLQRLHIGVFSAHAHAGASLAAEGLFALITKHAACRHNVRPFEEE